MTKVFFTSSTTNFYSNADRYQKIIDILRDNKLHVTSNISIDEFYNPDPNKDYSVYSNSTTYLGTLKKILDADIVILDASVRSMTIGILFSYSQMYKKPCLLLVAETMDDDKDMFVSGSDQPNFVFEVYTPQTIERIIATFLRKISKKRTERVNFVFDSDVISRLDWLAFKMRISRTEVVRQALDRMSPES